MIDDIGSRLALVAVLTLAGCSKKEAAKDPQPEMGPTAEMFDPAKLPGPGAAPPPVAITKELDPMWSVPLKTLQGKAITLAD